VAYAIIQNKWAHNRRSAPFDLYNLVALATVMCGKVEVRCGLGVNDGETLVPVVADPCAAIFVLNRAPDVPVLRAQ
jgi:hypothetical protein|tara:strand:- start:349 stop:576 length:228 start_codon:yes stop_codon:yes gene_type:complete